MALIPQIARAGDQGLLDVHDDPVHPLGSIFRDEETGYVWQYLKAGNDFDYGDTVEPWYEMFTITNLANAAAAGTRELNVGDSVELLGSSSNLRHIKNRSKQKEFAMLHVVGGTGVGQIGVILDIEDHKLVVEWLNEEGTLTTALDTSSDIKIFAPWFGRKTTQLDKPTLAVVQQWDGLKMNQYFWGGSCLTGAIKLGAGSTDVAVVAGDDLTTVATINSVINGAVAPGTATTSHRTATALDTVTLATDNASLIIPALIACELMPGEVPTRVDLGYISSTVAPAAE